MIDIWNVAPKLRLAVAFEIQKVENIPMEQWDKSMKKIITEQGIYSPVK